MASIDKKVLLNEALTASKSGVAQLMEQKHKAFVAFLDCTAIDGGTTLTGKIQHSPDKTNWFDLATFANLVGVTGNEVINVTDNVLTYVRADVALAGGGLTATAKIELYFDPDK